MNIERLFAALSKILSEKENARITLTAVKRGDAKCQ